MFRSQNNFTSRSQFQFIRQTQHAMLTVSGIFALAMPTLAATVSSTSTWGLNSSSGSAPIATTYVHGYVGSSVEDPIGAKMSGTFRLWSGADVNLTSGNQYAQVFVTQGLTTKTITTNANGSITKKAHAHGKDPFGYKPQAKEHQVSLSILLENTMVSSLVGETGKLTHTREIEIGTKRSKLYDLVISAQNGGAPVVSLIVYPTAANQGWNAEALKNMILTSLTPGTTPGTWIIPGKINFPVLRFRVPAKTKFDLYTSDEGDAG